MSTRFVLDTDTLVDVLRGRNGVAHRLASHSPDDVAMASMTLSELIYGALGAVDPDGERTSVERLAVRVRVLPFDRSAAVVHAHLAWDLRASPIGSADTVIAATALAARATLVTSNVREFQRVPGLEVVSWRE